jgi:hypothetical protein
MAILHHKRVTASARIPIVAMGGRRVGANGADDDQHEHGGGEIKR